MAYKKYRQAVQYYYSILQQNYVNISYIQNRNTMWAVFVSTESYIEYLTKYFEKNIIITDEPFYNDSRGNGIFQLNKPFERLLMSDLSHHIYIPDIWAQLYSQDFFIA